MKKYIFGAVLSLGLLVSPAFTQAAGLTTTQINAIISLLSSFGADQSVINRVSTTLNHGTPSTTTVTTSTVQNSSTQTILKSNFLKDDQTAESIASGQITNYDITTFSTVFSPFDTTSFAYRFVSALRMLGYTASFMSGNTAEAFLNNFEKANGYAQSSLITKQIIVDVDSKLVQVEARDFALANSFPIYKYYINVPANEPPKEHAAALFSTAFKNLPSNLVTWSEQGFLDYLSNQQPARIISPKTGIGSYSVCDSTMYQEIRDTCKVDPAINYVYAYSNDFDDANLLLHEYAHYLDGNIFSKGAGVSRGIIDTTGFYGISYNVSDMKIMSSGWKSYTFKNPTNIQNELVSAYAQGWSDDHTPGYYTAQEDFAESFAMYVTQGKVFRALAVTNSVLKQKYEWLKQNVFNGTEYATGADNALSAVRNNPNHGLNLGASTGVFNVEEFSLAIPGFVWNYSFPVLVSTSVPAPTSLTSTQIQSILSLLSSFGASPTAIANVNTILNGGTVPTSNWAPSGLTSQHLQSISSLLSSFGASSTMITNVITVLSAAVVTSIPTPVLAAIKSSVAPSENFTLSWGGNQIMNYLEVNGVLKGPYTVNTYTTNFDALATGASAYTFRARTCNIISDISNPADANCSAWSNSVTTTKSVVTPAPTVTIDSFSPSTITVGQSAIIGFTSTNATSCTGSGLWNGNLGGTYTPAGGRSTGPMNTPGTYTQTVICGGSGGSATSVTRTLTVTASTTPAPTVTIDAFSPSTITVGQSATIGFTSTNATACYGSGLWNGDLGGTYTPAGGKSTGPINTPGTYTQSVTCTGQGGSVTSVTRTLTVTASTTPAPTVTIDAFSPSTITVGQSATIGFTSTNATACYGSGLWNGDLGGTYTPAGGKSTGPINVAGTYTQSVTCTGQGGSATSVTRTLTAIASTVLAPTVTIDSFSPSTITQGQSAIIGFTSTNATACYGSGLWNGNLGGTYTPAGGKSTGPMNTPGTYTQSVTCTGAGGSVTSVTRTLTVTGQTASAYDAFNSATNAGPSESLGSGDTNSFHYVWNNNLQIGSSYTEDVKALQTALTSDGEYTGDISGGFYNQTFAAVKAFQQKYGIDTGTNGAGFVGLQTRAKLNTLY